MREIPSRSRPAANTAGHLFGFSWNSKGVTLTKIQNRECEFVIHFQLGEEQTVQHRWLFPPCSC